MAGGREGVLVAFFATPSEDGRKAGRSMAGSRAFAQAENRISGPTHLPKHPILGFFLPGWNDWNDQVAEFHHANYADAQVQDSLRR